MIENTDKSAGVRKSYKINLSTARDGYLETVAGKFIRIADASDNSANIQIAIERNNPANYESLKKNGALIEGNGFNRIYFKNEAQAGKWVRVIVSEGSADYDVDNPSLGTIESIGAIDDPVDINGAVFTGDYLKTYDIQNLYIKQLLDGTNQDLKVGSISVENASYAFARNATTVLATAGANTAGVRIYGGFGHIITAASCGLELDGNPIFYMESGSGGYDNQLIPYYTIEAGIEVSIVSSGAAADIGVFYEVLS